MNNKDLSEKAETSASIDAISTQIVKPAKAGVKSQAQTYDILTLLSFLDKLNKNTKVKIIIEDFDSFKQFLPLVNKYTAKFDVFKYETKFEVVSINNQNKVEKEIKNFKDSFNQWLDTQNVDKSIRNLLLEELK
jgi:hypothetical protein